MATTQNRAQMESQGYKYIGTMSGVNAAKKAGQNVTKVGVNYYISPTPQAGGALPAGGATQNTNPTPAAPNPGAPTPVAPNPGAPAPAPAPAAATGGSGATAAPSPTDAPPGSSAAPDNRHVGPSEYDAIRTKYGVTPDNFDKYFVRNPAGMPSGIYVKPEFDPRITRSSREATGYSYLGTMAKVDAAKKAGQEVKMLNGLYYIVPKKAAQTTDTLRTDIAQTPVTPDPSKPAGSPANPISDPFATNFPGATAAGGAPVPPDLINTYNAYNSTYKIEDAQTAVNDAQSALDNLDAAYLAGTHNVDNSLSPMQIIRGEQGVLQQQYNEKRFIAVNLLNLTSKILESKQKMVETMVNLTGQNYEMSSKAYNDAYTRSMDMAKFNETKREFDASQAFDEKKFQADLDKAAGDDARANLTAFGSALTASGKTWADLTPAQRSTVRDLELKAGMPIGTMENFYAQNKDVKVITTTINDAGQVSIVYSNPDGTMGVKQVGGENVGPTYHAPAGSSSTTLSNIEEPSHKNEDGSVDASGGLHFYATQGTGANAKRVNITAAQYAASQKKGVIAVLMKGSQDDIAYGNAVAAKLQDYAAKGYTSTQVLALFQGGDRPWIWDGIDPADFENITGYTPNKKA
jgi:hypothetical protein